MDPVKNRKEILWTLRGIPSRVFTGSLATTSLCLSRKALLMINDVNDNYDNSPVGRLFCLLFAILLLILLPLLLVPIIISYPDSRHIYRTEPFKSLCVMYR